MFVMRRNRDTSVSSVPCRKNFFLVMTLLLLLASLRKPQNENPRKTAMLCLW